MVGEPVKSEINGFRVFRIVVLIIAEIEGFDIFQILIALISKALSRIFRLFRKTGRVRIYPAQCGRRGPANGRLHQVVCPVIRGIRVFVSVAAEEGTRVCAGRVLICPFQEDDIFQFLSIGKRDHYNKGKHDAKNGPETINCLHDLLLSNRF